MVPLGAAAGHSECFCIAQGNLSGRISKSIQVQT